MNRNLAVFARDLRTLHIQGATAVAHETLRALEGYCRASRAPVSARDWRSLKEIGGELGNIRPTEPLSRNVVSWYLSELKRGWEAVSLRTTWAQHATTCAREIQYALKEIEAQVVAHGAKLVKSGQTIFTHCHSALAERVLVRAKRSGRNFQVYHTETRPLYQGHITDERLRQAGIVTTMVVDSAAAYLISRHSGDDVDISWVLLGADSISHDGSVLNKIGSFGIALAAHDSKIPLYVATTLLKFDAAGVSTIERRAASEVWAGAPAGTNIVNYAFDRVPAEFITGIVSEFGVIKPREVRSIVRRRYPWLARHP